MQKKFNQRILIIGFGSVAQCTLPILFKHINVKYDHVTVMDFEDKQALLQPWIDQGVHYAREKINQSMIAEQLEKYLQPGDMLIDLAWNIGAEDIIQWCHDHEVNYLNTSIELWDPYTASHQKHPTEKTLYYRHMRLRDMMKSWKKKGPTIITEHGANPGLISSLVKQGLIDIAKKMIRDRLVLNEDKVMLEALIDQQKFHEIAQRIGVKVIHISE
ncbi:MAG: saccharopine dehydrogenase NADP-binding domain-containing protein, partial [Bacilli bacterium]